jgi:hypothetical protein
VSRWLRFIALVLAACSSSDDEPAADRVEPVAGDEPAGEVDLSPLPGLPPYPPHVKSLRLRRSISVRLEPSGEAKRLGTVAQDTRVGFNRARLGPGCDRRWIEIEPRGWVCESNLEATRKPIIGVELPKLEIGELVPGAYGKLAKQARILTWKEGALVGERTLAGAATVRRYGEAIIRGANHWRIGTDEYVQAKLVTPHDPSTWHGVRLGDETGRGLPLAFALGEKNAAARVQVWSDAAATVPLRLAARRAVVPVLETTGEVVRIGDGEWMRAADLRVARTTRPPPATEPGERWFDLDLDSQVLVAYEGTQPVYATLVSSGTKKTPTETGIFRIWVKFAETDMSGQMGDDEAYSVATVPWTQFYAKDLALHTTYWHDRLGQARSHGCVNLAPLDARFLYFWSEPTVPPGWSMAHGVVERPGSMVRVRSAADPDPPFKGYAMRVDQARRPDATAGAPPAE